MKSAGGALVEQQREDADQRVDAHLGEQSGKRRADRRRGRVIRGWQPEEQREQPGLDAERDQEQHREHGVDAGRADGRPHAREIGHVERPGGAVQQPERGQKDGRCDQVDRDVLERRLHLRAGPVERHQHERRHQHDLEPHVEVEEVAGQEGPGDSHQQDLHQRVVAEGFPPRIDAGKRDDR